MAVSNTMVQTNVDTNKHEDFNLVFTNQGKEEAYFNLLQRSHFFFSSSANLKT
jgi:hypothetical protein